MPQDAPTIGIYGDEDHYDRSLREVAANRWNFEFSSWGYEVALDTRTLLALFLYLPCDIFIDAPRVLAPSFHYMVLLPGSCLDDDNVMNYTRICQKHPILLPLGSDCGRA